MSNPIEKAKSNVLLLSKLSKYINYSAPICVLLAAGSVYYATTQLHDFLNVGAKSIAVEQNKATQVINKVGLDEASYKEIINVLSLNNPAVHVALNEDHNSIDVSLSSAEHLTEWVYLLSTLQSYRPGLIWKASMICLNNCKSKLPVEAQLTAYSQAITTKK